MKVIIQDDNGQTVAEYADAMWGGGLREWMRAQLAKPKEVPYALKVRAEARAKGLPVPSMSEVGRRLVRKPGDVSVTPANAELKATPN